MSPALEFGQKVRAEDGTIGTVTCVYEDGGFDIAYEDSDITHTDADGNTEVTEHIEEDPKEARRRENIALGRHPLFVPIMEAPKDGFDWVRSSQSPWRARPSGLTTCPSICARRRKV